MLMRIKTLWFSTIGDFFLATGKNLVNIWKRDKLDCFNSEILLTGKENLQKLPSWTVKALEIKDLGRIIESHITVNGRLFFTLEDGQKFIKVWYNAFTEEELKTKLEKE